MTIRGRDTLPWSLAVGLVLAAGTAMTVRPDPAPRPGGTGAVPVVEAADAFVQEGGRITVRSTGGGPLLVSTEADGPLRPCGSDRLTLQVSGDARRTERLVSIPTSLAWRHPEPGQPSAFVLRVAEQDDAGRAGPVRLFTGVLEDHGDLPVVSLVVDEAALFAADSGIYVVGDAIMHPTEEMMRLQSQDARWWKYPGNFHFRGKEWQRPALMQVIGADGAEIVQCEVGLRINGQMTRGFAQHALRLVFDTPMGTPLFPGGEGEGARAMVLRSGGNDQGRAMMRDAVAHALCAGAGFEVGLATTCVVYVNGAYWGLHHLRQRVDEKELARRHDLSPKSVGMVELRMKRSYGEPEHVIPFRHMLSLVKEWDGTDAVRGARIDSALDMETFLRYMAATMIIGNKDWPSDNVKFWRSTERADGRWYPLLGDSDLGLGASMPASADLFAQVKGLGSPLPDMFSAVMRAPRHQARFEAIVREFVAGRFSPEQATAVVDRFARRMAPEMGRQCARWRKPMSRSVWEAEVAALRAYVNDRAAYVVQDLEERSAR